MSSALMKLGIVRGGAVTLVVVLAIGARITISLTVFVLLNDLTRASGGGDCSRQT